jgi:hypothetical protein
MKAPKSHHLRLASRLLEMAAREFHEHGCTDTDPEVFRGIDMKSRDAMLEEFNELYQSTFQVPVPPLEFDRVGIDMWMDYMAWRLSGEKLPSKGGSIDG